MDTQLLINRLIIIFIAMLLIAFFAGVEIAFLASSSVKIELKARQGDTAAKILSFFKKNISKFLITILIGTNVALVLYSQKFNALTLEPIVRLTGLDEEYNFLIINFIQSVFATLFLLVLAEYIPKAIFRRNADTIVYPSSYLLQIFYWILWIPVNIANFISKGLLRLMGISLDEGVVGIDRKDLEMYIQEVIDSSEAEDMPELDTEILSNAMEFPELRVKEIMIPRTQIVALPYDTSIEALRQHFIDTKLSRIIIYKENLDEIQGFIHSISLFKNPTSIEPLLQQALIVPEVMPADVLIKEFGESRRSLAIVVDEFGGTAGMITLEDLIEEVFGDIEDEHDEGESAPVDEDLKVTTHDDGSMTIGARNAIYDLNETYNLNLEESDNYTTLGGYLLNELGEIPAEGAIIDDIHDAYIFDILKASPTKVISIKLRNKK